MKKKVGCSSTECLLVDNRDKGGMNTPCLCLRNLNMTEIIVVEEKLRRLRMLEENIKNMIRRK